MNGRDDVLAAYERVLLGVSRLPPSQIQAPTFLEIAGYPHLENVASNILQFFLQPQAEHNLQGLVLDSLLSLLGIDGEESSFAEVKREVTTERGNRIDLVVESDTFIIGIENKIYHGLHNDFADYRKYLVKQSGGKTPYGVLLGLTVPRSVPLHGFQAITYTQLLDQIDARLDKIDRRIDAPYNAFLIDWMKTMRRLTQETALSPQVLAFLGEHQDDINRMLREADIIKNEMRRKVKTLLDLIAPDVQTIPIFVAQGLWRDTRLVDVLYNDFDGDDGLVVAVDIVIEPTGWRIEIHNRRGSIQQLEEWLAVRSITTKVRNAEVFRLAYGETVLPYTADLTVVKEIAQDLFSKIRG